MEIINAALAHHLQDCDERMLFEVAASFHRCRLGPQGLPEMLLQELTASCPPDGRCPAMVFRACSASSAPLEPRTVTAALDTILRRGLASWDLHSLSMFAAALTKLGIDRKRVLQRVAQAAVRWCDHNGAAGHSGLRSLQSLLWAFAKAGHTQSSYVTLLFQITGRIILEAAESPRGAPGPRAAPRSHGNCLRLHILVRCPVQQGGPDLPSHILT